VGDYYQTIENDCVPIGKAVNPNIAIVSPLMCCPTEEEAREKGWKGLNFFGFGLAWHYVFGSHEPGKTSIWDAYERNGADFLSFRERQLQQHPDAIRGCIGSPEQIREVVMAAIEGDGSQSFDGFDCGTLELNTWLTERALSNQPVGGSARTYVALDPEGRVAAYYASSTATVLRSDSPGRMRRNQPDPSRMRTRRVGGYRA
jgi:hypothetical protein